MTKGSGVGGQGPGAARQGIGIGLAFGAGAVVMTVVGLIDALRTVPVMGTEIAVAWVVLAALAVVAGRTARSIVGGALAGTAMGGLLGLFAVLGLAVDLSVVFDRVLPPLIRFLLFDLGPAGLLPLLAGGALLGAAGAIANAASRTDPSPASQLSRSIPPSAFRLPPFAFLALAFLALLLAPWLLGSYWTFVLGTVGLYVLLGLGLNIVVGYAGLLDLGYVAFYAIGAYTVALLSAPDKAILLGFWPAVPLAMLFAGLAGVLLGIPVLRLRGDYLAIVTLGFGEIIRLLINNLTGLTGGPQGVIDIPQPRLFGLLFESPTAFFYLIAASCLLVAFVSARLARSRIGRAWTAIREDEDVALAMGIPTVRYKLLAFAIGAGFAGLAGAIFAARQGAIFPADFTLLVSVYVLCLIIIGGLGSIPGIVIGAAVLVGLPEVLREIADFRLLTFGALLVLMMIVRPQGLLPSRRRAREITRQAGA